MSAQSLTTFARGTVLAALVAIPVACSEPPPPAPPPQPVAPPSSAPNAPAVSPQSTTTSPSQPAAPPPPTVEKLTEALRVYMQVSSDYPKDLSVLVERKLVPRIPPPPPGKRFAIDPKTVSVIVVDP